MNTVRKLMMSCSGEFAAIPVSSTYCAHLSALITGSNFSPIKVEKTDKSLLRLCASLQYAKILQAKVNASVSNDC